jgi:ArsR family transcriptional regulator
MLAPDRALKLAEQHSVLSDPIRLQLLHLIASHPDGEVRAGVLSARVERAPSTVSHHLALLLGAGLVRRRRQGRERLYRPTAAGQRAAAIGPR